LIARSDKVAGHPVFFLPDLSQAGDFFPASGKFGAKAAGVELAVRGGLMGVAIPMVRGEFLFS